MKILSAIAVLLLWTGCYSHTAFADLRDVRILFPTLQGDGAIAWPVTTVFHLQIWKTLRKAPWPNPSDLYFGNGTLFSSEFSFKVDDPEKVITFGRANKFDTIIWGKVYRLGSDAIVHLRFSLPKLAAWQSQPEQWVVEINSGEAGINLVADIPRRSYEFEPIVVNKELVQEYSELTALPVFKTPGGARIGKLQFPFSAIKHEREWTFLCSGGFVDSPDCTKGWVRTPLIGKQRSEAIDFVSGLIRVLRTDWLGATSLLDRVSKNPATPTEVLIDTYLLLGLAKKKLSEDGRHYFRKALDLSPTSRRVLVYFFMGEIEEVLRLLRNRRTKKASELLEQIVQVRTQYRNVFSANDPWLTKLDLVIQNLREEAK